MSVLGPAQGYSPELCVALRTFVLPDCQDDELALCQQFDQPDQNRKWREGVIKSSFNYLLLDPRSVVIVWLFQCLNESFLCILSPENNNPGPSPPNGVKFIADRRFLILSLGHFLNNFISLSMFLFRPFFFFFYCIRVTKNLPYRSHSMSPMDCFQTFISAIFYVGKGKRSRPYSHLYEALDYHRGDKTSKVGVTFFNYI